jgi:mannose-1-phosphate guanylyltransferase
MEHTYAVIMAGGGGTRLWPISRKKHPKHVLPLLGDRTLFQITFDRLEGLIPWERVWVGTTADQEDELRSQAPQLPQDNLIIEPMPRGTASVVGLAAKILQRRDPEAVMMVLPADHFIQNRVKFHQVMHTAVTVARKDYLVTLGINPTYPATGYGYIQWGAPLPERFDLPSYHVLRFTEKPDETTAQLMLAEGNHSWNSGMFIWRVGLILDEISRQMPELNKALDQIEAAWGHHEQQAVLKSIWPKLKVETIDYGIMEHAARVAVVPAADLKWSDVGAWDSLFEVLHPDENGNVVVNSDHLPIETRNSLIYSTRNKLVVTIGVNDLLVIDSGDALLICHRQNAQQVREAIENLKKKKKEDYL